MFEIALVSLCALVLLSLGTVLGTLLLARSHATALLEETRRHCDASERWADELLKHTHAKNLQEKVHADALRDNLALMNERMRERALGQNGGPAMQVPDAPGAGPMSAFPAEGRRLASKSKFDELIDKGEITNDKGEVLELA